MLYANDSVFAKFFYSFPVQEPKPPISVELIRSREGAELAAQIQFAVAGFDEEDLKVYFEDRTLFIEGDNLDHKYISDKFKCSFARKISIKENIDLTEAKITLENGILNIFLPVIEPDKVRTYILGGKD